MIPTFPAPVTHSFDGYADLRAVSGMDVGQLISLTSSGNPEIDGIFAFVSTDPLGDGDDGGIIIAATNGWWVRQFFGVIELDWFLLSDTDDITTLFTNLASSYAPTFKTRVPNQAIELILDTVDLDAAGVTTWEFLESASAVQITQDSSGADKFRLFTLSDYISIIIGGSNLNLSFQGRHTGIRGGYNGGGGEPAPANAMFYFSQTTSNGLECSFLANVYDSWAGGIRHVGTGAQNDLRTDKWTIGGNFLNSGVAVNSGVKDLHCDSLEVSDPYGVGLGWDGTTKPNNDKDFSEKTRTLHAQRLDRLTGVLHIEHGSDGGLFLQGIEFIGNSADDPFHYKYNDAPFSGPATPNGPANTAGIEIGIEGFLVLAGKGDFVDQNSGGDGPGKKFFKIEELASTYGYLYARTLIWEATSDSPPGVYTNTNIDTELVNISGNIISYTYSNNGVADRSSGHSWKGNIVSGGILEIHDTDTVDGLTAGMVVFELATKDEIEMAARNCIVRNSTFTDDVIFDLDGHDNSLSNVNINSAGKIVVQGGNDFASGALDGITFGGSSRVVVDIQNSGDTDPVVLMEFTTLSAPSGSTITATDTGNATVKIDGDTKTLPFTF